MNLYFYFGNFVTKNRAIGNNTTFPQHFFRFRGGGHFPLSPWLRPCYTGHLDPSNAIKALEFRTKLPKFFLCILGLYTKLLIKASKYNIENFGGSRPPLGLCFSKITLRVNGQRLIFKRPSLGHPKWTCTLETLQMFHFRL